MSKHIFTCLLPDCTTITSFFFLCLLNLYQGIYQQQLNSSPPLDLYLVFYLQIYQITTNPFFASADQSPSPSLTCPRALFHIVGLT